MREPHGLRIAALLIGLLLRAGGCAMPAHAGTPDTATPLPAQGASFFARLLDFLKFEDSSRFAEQFTGFVVSGCTHSTTVGLTATPSTCTAYPAGVRIVETGSITYVDAAGYCWTIVDAQTSGNLFTNVIWTRTAGTHYLTACGVGSQPSIPDGTILTMRVATSAGSIVEVQPMAPHRPSADSCLDFKRDCGLVGDDSDETAALLGCLDRFTNRRGCWTAPAGTYKFSSTLSWPGIAGSGTSNGCALRGAGSGTTTLHYTGNDYALRFAGAAGSSLGVQQCTVEGLKIKADASAAGGVDFVDETTNDTLRNVVIEGAALGTGIGVRMTGGINCNCFNRLDGVVVRLWLKGISTSGFANNNLFTNVRCNNTTTCYDIANGDDNVFVDAHCSASGGTCTTCVSLTGSADRNRFVGLVDDGCTNSWTANSGNLQTTCFGCQLGGIVTPTSSGIASYGGSGTFTLLNGVATLYDGLLFYCTDCNHAAKCSAGGTGAWMKRLNGGWVCDGNGPNATMAFGPNDPTPDVSGGDAFRTANSSATTITNFTNGIDGQSIFLRFNDGFTNLDCSANAALKCNNTNLRDQDVGGVANCTGVGAPFNCCSGAGAGMTCIHANDHMRCTYNGATWFCAVTASGS